MPAYALLLRPAPNRLYTKGAAPLNAAELSVVAERVLGGALHAVEPGVRIEPDVVDTADDGRLDDLAITHLSNLSAAFALFEVTGATLVPVPMAPTACLDDDLLTIQRYKGKTNEQFTKLLCNVTLAASAHAATWPGRRLRLLDPVCGRGTTLNQALVYGFDADGIELDRAACDAYRAFLLAWLRDKRFKHDAETTPLRRDGKVVGRRTEIAFAPDKQAYKAGNGQRVRIVNDDTHHAAEHYPRPVFDVVVADLPYGVQHASRAPAGARSRRPGELLDGALGGWVRAMKPGAAIGLSWNAKVLPRAELVGCLARHGLEPCTTGAFADARFEHRVDQAITRDVAVAAKPA